MRFYPPPPRAAHRFEDLFGSDGCAGQTQDMIDDAVQRVFDFLPNKSDQRALTFVDQGTRASLLPKLYHTVTISIADYPYNIIAVTNLFDPNNPGRDFIKRVVFDGSSIGFKSSPPCGYTHLASLAIENLPLYQLERFEWPSDCQLPAMYTLRLLDRQDNLKNLELYNDTLSTRVSERKATLDALTELESLRVAAENKDGLRFISQIIKTHQLKELSVDLVKFRPPQWDLDYSQPQLAETDVCEILFQHAMPLYKCPLKYQLPLSCLHLRRVNLYRSAETWFKVLRPMCLKELDMNLCTWGSNLLTLLGRTQPNLEKVTIAHMTSPNDDEMDKAPANKKHGLTFDKALGLFLKELADAKAKAEAPPLRSFILHLLDADHYEFFEDGALAAHTPDLEIMALDFGTWTVSITKMQGLSEALEACNVLRLRQLALPIQALLDVDAPKPLTLNPVALTLVQCLDSIGDVRAQEVADRALSVLHATHKEKLRLRVLAVDSSSGNGDWGTIDYFVKCEVDVMGRKKSVMVPVEYDEVKKFEQEIDIF